MRAIAVLLVVVSHLRIPVAWDRDDLYNLEALGRLGVVIFFMHTTLVLLMSLERSGDSFPQFMIKRVFRIYPLSCLIVLLVFLPGLTGSAPLNAGQFASNLFLVQNITGHSSMPHPLWTLPYELQMYLFLPVVFAITRAPRSKLLIALLCIGATGLALLGFATNNEIRLLRFVPCFLPGALAFVLWSKNPRCSPLPLFAVLAASIAVIPLVVEPGKPDSPVFWVLSLALGAVVPHCRQIRNGWLARVSTTIAKYSYGVYLTHVFAVALAFAGGSTGLFAWATFVVMLAFLPWIAYHGVEKHGMALGKRLAARSPAKLDSKNLGAATGSN